ncbi:prolipoprotein diacylglyceryl transferase [Oscillospiraceae bacterium]|nr:prolipoprotein diacylglyceryl transferase [Oscillospiraceae bacterium]
MSTVSFPGLGFAVNVKEIAFRIFNWPIHWYGIIIAAGFLLAVYYCCRKAADYGIEQDDIIDLLIFAVPLCIIGARLYYVIFYLDLYRNPDGSLDFLRMLRIWDGGLAIYGGIIVAILTLLIFCKIKKIPFLAFADVGSFGMLIGQLVGRWGNFVNVEAYGAPTDLPWRMGIYDTVNGVYQYMEVHPTFLYESLWNLVGFLLLALVVAKHRKFDGQIFLGYIAWYGLGRAWIEGLRTDSLYFFSTGLRVSQILALISFVLALAVMIVQLRRKHDPKELWVNQVKARKAAATGAEEGSAIMGEPEDLTQEEPEEKEEDTDDPA